MNFLSKSVGAQYRISNAFQRRCFSDDGQWTGWVSESIHINAFSSGDMASRLVIPGSRIEWDDVLPVDVPDDNNTVRVRYYSELVQPQSGYSTNYEPLLYTQASLPAGPNPPGPYPQSPYTAESSGPPQRIFAPFFGYETFWGWPQGMSHVYHAGYAGNPGDLYNLEMTRVTSSIGKELLSVSGQFASFAMASPRALAGVPGSAADTFLVYVGQRTRIKAVGGSVPAFIIKVTLSYEDDSPYSQGDPSWGALVNRIYDVASIHLVEQFTLTTSTFKEIPITNIGEYVFHFIVLEETPAEWQARTGLTFT